MGVLEFLCDRRFHKSYFLPPNPESGRIKPFRVSYADYGDPTSDAVVLVCGALMAMRLSYLTLDQIAKDAHVRIIHPDRPGVGGTEAVEVHERISMWIEIVPQLLSHLNIPHVSLVSHSGGDIYLLNTMLRYSHLLHPKTPHVTFFAPWVHYSHSKVGQMMATQLLPSPLIGKFASVVKLVYNNVIPLAGMSHGLLHGIKGSMTPSAPKPAPILLDPSAPASASRTSLSSHSGQFDIDLNDNAVTAELRDLCVTYMFTESTDGVSSDAQLFLKNPHTLSWSLPEMNWMDVNEFVPIMSKIMEEDKKNNRNWTVDVFHAEDDNMVGEKGKQWWDGCWTPNKASSTSNDEAQPSTELPSTAYEYRSETVKGTDHNYLMDSVYGASQIWLSRVRQAFPPSTEDGQQDDAASPSPEPPFEKKKTFIKIGFIARRFRNVVDVLAFRRRLP